MPVQFSTFANGHTGSLRQQPDHRVDGLNHKIAKLNSCVSGIRDGAKRFLGLLLVVENSSQHKLLNCFLHPYHLPVFIITQSDAEEKKVMPWRRKLMRFLFFSGDTFCIVYTRIIPIIAVFFHKNDEEDCV